MTTVRSSSLCNSLKSGDAHQTWDLADGNRDGGTSHEPADCRSGNEVDDPTDSQEAYRKDAEPLRRFVRGLSSKGMAQDLQRRKRRLLQSAGLPIRWDAISVYA